MKRIMQGVEYIAIAVLLSLSAIIILQVIMRNFFGTGFVWVEELSRFLLLSMVLISAPVVFYHGAHVKFDLFYRKLSVRGKMIHSLVLVSLIVFFHVVYIVSHYQLMKNSGNVLSPCLSIPNRYYFAAGLIGAVIAIAAGISRIIGILKGD